MPTDFSSQDLLLRNFNRKYVVEFSYEDFETEVRKNKSLEKNYLRAFSDFYRQALTNYADRKIDSFSTREFLHDYENLMNGYKTVINKDKTEIKKWPQSAELLDKVQKDLSEKKNEIPDTKQEYIMKRYLDRKLPIRKMREYAKELMDSNCKDPEQLSVVLGYSKALSEVNYNRPRWWRIIHPFRNRAEKREANLFKKMVSKQFGGIFVDSPRRLPQTKEERANAIVNARPIVGATQFTSTLTDKFVMARTILEDSSLADAKEEIKQLSAELKTEAGKKAFEAEKIKPVQEEKKQDIVELQRNASKEVDPQTFLKTGYVPNIFNLEKESIVANNVDSALKKEIHLNQKYETYKQAQELFEINRTRLNDLMSTREHIRPEQIRVNSEIYKAQDEAWMEKNPNYVAPELPKEISSTRQQIDVSKDISEKDNQKNTEIIKDPSIQKKELNL